MSRNKAFTTYFSRTKHRCFFSFLDDNTMFFVDYWLDSFGQRCSARVLRLNDISGHCRSMEYAQWGLAFGHVLFCKRYGCDSYSTLNLIPMFYSYFGGDSLYYLYYYAHTVRSNIPRASLKWHLQNLQGMYDRGVLV